MYKWLKYLPVVYVPSFGRCTVCENKHVACGFLNICLLNGTDYSVAFLQLALQCGCWHSTMFVLYSYKILQLPVLYQIPLCWQLCLMLSKVQGKLQTQPLQFELFCLSRCMILPWRDLGYLWRGFADCFMTSAQEFSFESCTHHFH